MRGLVPPLSATHAASRAPAVTMQYYDVRALPGVTEPLGFFDPLGFTVGASEGRIKFLREVEIKHSRVAMLATGARVALSALVHLLRAVFLFHFRAL